MLSPILKKSSLPYDHVIYVIYAMKFFVFITLKWCRSSNYQMPLHIFLKSLTSNHLFQVNKGHYMLCCSHSSHAHHLCSFILSHMLCQMFFTLSPKFPWILALLRTIPSFIKYTLPKVLVSQMERLYLGGVQNLESPFKL